MIEFKGLIKDVILKIKRIKSSLILPNVCLKHRFNLFRFEKAQAAQDEQLFS